MDAGKILATLKIERTKTEKLLALLETLAQMQTREPKKGDRMQWIAGLREMREHIVLCESAASELVHGKRRGRPRKNAAPAKGKSE